MRSFLLPIILALIGLGVIVSTQWGDKRRDAALPPARIEHKTSNQRLAPVEDLTLHQVIKALAQESQTASLPRYSEAWIGEMIPNETDRQAGREIGTLLLKTSSIDTYSEAVSAIAEVITSEEKAVLDQFIAAIPEKFSNVNRPKPGSRDFSEFILAMKKNPVQSLIRLCTQLLNLNDYDTLRGALLSELKNKRPQLIQIASLSPGWLPEREMNICLFGHRHMSESQREKFTEFLRSEPVQRIGRQFLHFKIQWIKSAFAGL